MKKPIIYSIIFLFVFMIFMPFLSADSEYRFSCEYDVYTEKDEFGEKTNPLRLRAEIFEDSATLKLNGVELVDSMSTQDINKDFGSSLSKISFDSNQFYNYSVQYGDTCPNVTLRIDTLDLDSIPILGVVDPTHPLQETILNKILEFFVSSLDELFDKTFKNYYLLFNVDSDEGAPLKDSEYIFADKINDNPEYNPNVKPGEEIENPVKPVNECSYYYNGGLTKFNDNYKISFRTLNNGKKVVNVHNVNGSGDYTEPFDNVGDNGQVYGASSATIEIGNIELYVEDEKLFGPNCIDSDKVYFAEDKASTEKNPLYFITSDKDYFDEYVSKTGVLRSVTLSDELTQYKPDGGIKDNSTSRIGFCTTYLGSVDDEGDNVAKFLDEIYTLIKIGSIVATIVLSMIELAQVIVKSKDDLMPTITKIAKRLIILILILMLPSIIDLFGNLFGYKDVLCGIK